MFLSIGFGAVVGIGIALLLFVVAMTLGRAW